MGMQRPSFSKLGAASRKTSKMKDTGEYSSEEKLYHIGIVIIVMSSRNSTFMTTTLFSFRIIILMMIDVISCLRKIFCPQHDLRFFSISLFSVRIEVFFSFVWVSYYSSPVEQWFTVVLQVVFYNYRKWIFLHQRKNWTLWKSVQEFWKKVKQRFIMSVPQSLNINYSSDIKFYFLLKLSEKRA